MFSGAFSKEKHWRSCFSCSLHQSIIFFLAIYKSVNFLFLNWCGPPPSSRRKIWWGGHSRTTCIHIIRPTAGLRAAASRRGAAWVEDIVHRALHLTVVNGLALVGAERERRQEGVCLILKAGEEEGVRGMSLYFEINLLIFPGFS